MCRYVQGTRGVVDDTVALVPDTEILVLARVKDVEGMVGLLCGGGSWEIVRLLRLCAL